MGIILEKEKCIKCNVCVDNCPEDILTMKNNQVYVAYPLECSWCGACEIDCPADAIHVRFTKEVGPVFIRREEK